MQSVIQGVQGFMYPNEAELQWSVLIVLYPFITGLVAGAFILASLERVFRVEAVKPTYRLALLTALAFLAGRAAASATAPRPSGAFVRDVPYAPHVVGHGDVRLRLPLVLDGGSAARNLAGLPQRHRAALAIQFRLHETDLPDADTGSQNISEEALRVDDQVGYIITVIGIPSAFMLHGYVGFIFGSVKANPWWSSPMMPIVFIFSAMVSGIAAVMLLYMVTVEAARHEDQHALRRYHRALSVLHLYHRLLA